MNKWVNLILICTIAFFSIYSYQNNTYTTADSKEYIAKARQLGIDNPTPVDLNDKQAVRNISKRPFAYPYFLRLFKLDIITILIAQALLCYLLLKDIYKTTYHKVADKRRFIILFLIFSLLSVNLFIYTGKVMSELLLAVLLWYSFKQIEKQSFFSKALFTILFTLLAFTKPVFFLFPIYFALIVFISKYRKAKWMYIASVIALLFYISHIQTNYSKTGVKEFSSIQSVNLLGYNYKYWEANKTSTEAAELKVDSVIDYTKSMSYPDEVNNWNRHAKEEILNAPMSYGLFHLKGSFRGIVDPGRYDFAQTFSLQQNGDSFLAASSDGKLMQTIKKIGFPLVIILGILLVFNGLRFVLAIDYFRLNYKKLRMQDIYALAALSYVILLSGPLNASRFMMPLAPFLLYYSLLRINKRSL